MICKTHSLNGDMFLNVRKGLSKKQKIKLQGEEFIWQAV
jgi:hypothetical protein